MLDDHATHEARRPLKLLELLSIDQNSMGKGSILMMVLLARAKRNLTSELMSEPMVPTALPYLLRHPAKAAFEHQQSHFRSIWEIIT